MGDVKSNQDNDPDNQGNDAVMPVQGDLSQERLPQALQQKVRLFAVQHALETPCDSLCQDRKTGRYYVSGRENAQSLLNALIPKIKQLSAQDTLRVNLSQICATIDFTQEVVSALFFEDSPYRPLTVGKQIVFFDPDEATKLAIRLSLSTSGVINTNCMIAERVGVLSWKLWLVGHIELHLEKILRYVRTRESVTARELVERDLSHHPGNASTRLKELWAMGLLRRSIIGPMPDKGGRPEYRYTAYHPLLDFLPQYPRRRLEYNQDISLHLRRQRKTASSEPPVS